MRCGAGGGCRAFFCFGLLSLVLLGGCGPPAKPALDAGSSTGDWPRHGLSNGEDRFSPLDSIRADNVARLGLSWTYDTGVARKHESTPIVIDGVMYLTAPWSIVHALDARSGEPLWLFDPQVPKDWGRYACCGVVNRGVAVHDGHVFVGSLDGRLIKLDASTGEPVWEVDTIEGRAPYTITGAPRIVKGRVIIGNGGAEYGVRGYVSAYDAVSGELAWRFFTVPGDPALPQENPALEPALATWSGEWWKIGGGGTAWDSMAYDASLDLLYVGTGNGSPWARTHRSPGGGDNLYLASILALDPDDGSLRWHYQTTPADNWDFTATQHMILTELEIGGEQRKVLLQAPKNGFFYVLDRETGELLSAEPFAALNWASHVDSETGRPVERPSANYDETPQIVSPSPGGAHNWPPMALHPDEGLVYVPTADSATAYQLEETFTPLPGTWNRGLSYDGAAYQALRAQVPPTKRYLLAWDPVRQAPRWRVDHARGDAGGGVLATAGGLVFQGTESGRLSAYGAADGELLWQQETRVGILAPPVSYEIDGEQYVAVVAGTAEQVDTLAHLEPLGRVFAFKLDADKALPMVATRAPRQLAPPELFGSAAQREHGSALYNQHCGRCHGWNAMADAGAIPDLRYADAQTHAAWQAIVRLGARASRGMAGFDDVLSEEDAEAIRSFVVAQAHALGPRAR